jgi:hypothetical protein
MRRFLIFSVIVLFLFGLSGSVPARRVLKESKNNESRQYLAMFDNLREMEADSTMVAEVSDFSFTRDVGHFILKNGIIIFCKPIDGRVVSAVFEGDGIFAYDPVDKIERLQLQRFYETDTLYREFTHLHLIFSDSTESELRERLDFKDGRIPKEAGDAIKKSLKYLYDKKTKYFSSDIMKNMLEGRTNING